MFSGIINSHTETKKNGRHFEVDIFKVIFLYENLGISIQISLNNMLALVHIVAWRRTGYKALFESMMA